MRPAEAEALKILARREGTTLSAYVAGVISEVLSRPAEQAA
ncbi:MAG TPA: hypothetical protein VGG41_07045 [Solirubrobacteraceae bacterium]